MSEKIGKTNEIKIVFGQSDNITHGSIVSMLQLNTRKNNGWNWNRLVSQREKGILPSDWRTRPFSLQRQTIDAYRTAILANLSVPFNNELADLLKMPWEQLKTLVKENDFITENAENITYLILKSGITHLRLVRNTEEAGRIVQKSSVIPIEQSAYSPNAYLLEQFALSVVANSVYDAKYYSDTPPVIAKRQFR